MTHAPTASFILLCYNQEETIASAVQSILDQDCEPIEILISDDASPDSTFAVIEGTVSSYEGPHTVIIRQNSENLGVNRHIEMAINLCQSDLMIWTAGDDVNAPNRAQKIIEAHKASKAKLIFSDAQTITDTCEPGASRYRGATLYHPFNLRKVATSFSLYLGATAAWHKDLFYKYGGFPAEKAHEDLILGFRAALEDSLHYIPEKLVTYREDVGVSSHLSGKNSTLKNRARRSAILKGQHTVLQQRLIDAETFGLMDDNSVCRNIRALRARIEMRLSYYEGNKRAHCRAPVLLIHALLSEWLRDVRNR